jgi:GGDEF domain-containing protein
MGNAELRIDRNDDPRRLRELLARVQELAVDHSLQSVVVGLAAPEGAELFPELVSFIESELRVEDAVFRMTRERAVLFLTDVRRDQAERVVDRLRAAFDDRYPTIEPVPVSLSFLEIDADCGDLRVKEVLPRVFPSPTDGSA